MKLDDNELSRLAEALTQRRARAACEVCGETLWTISTDIVEVPVVAQPMLGVVPKLIYAAAMVCKNCGNIRLHHLQTLGLADLLKNRGARV